MKLAVGVPGLLLIGTQFKWPCIIVLRVNDRKGSSNISLPKKGRLIYFIVKPRFVKNKLSIILIRQWAQQESLESGEKSFTNNANYCQREY